MMTTWPVPRVLVAGIALVLVLGASGEGCEEGPSGFSASRSECPDPTEVVFGSVGFVRIATPLARGELAEDVETAREIAQAVADFEDSSCGRAKRGVGYRVTVRTDGPAIVVRVMARGGGRENYYRVSVDNKGAVDKDGEYSRDPAATHHHITDFAIDEILELIEKIKTKSRERGQ